MAHQLTDRAANAIADLALLDAELRGDHQPVEEPTTAEPLDSLVPVVADAAHCEVRHIVDLLTHTSYIDGVIVRQWVA